VQNIKLKKYFTFFCNIFFEIIQLIQDGSPLATFDCTFLITHTLRKFIKKNVVI